MESHTHQDAVAPEGAEGQDGEGRRERRSRDRYGRDRRERGGEQRPAAHEDGAPQAAVLDTQEAQDTQPEGEAEVRRPRYATGFVNDEEVRAVEPQQAWQPPVQQAPVQAPVQAPAPAPVHTAVSAPAPAPAGLPKVASFELPLAQLQQVAEGSGLQWVNSDADKIAAVQAAIAAEPKPVRVPRERPPVVTIDEGPLVLVETRRDLGEMKLPFES